ncbi:MAG: hypothetical protein QXM75_03500 [Candidatus Diapherotrites archaeon]
MAIMLLLPCFAMALRYSIGDHYIFIILDEEGNAKVIEKFYLAFKSQSDIDAFASKKTELGNDVWQWQRFNPKFTFHVGGESYVKSESVSVSFNKENLDHTLEIHYELKQKAVSVVSEESRVVTYKTNSWLFIPFIQGTDYVIPEGTFIIINLPKDAELLTSDEIFKYATFEKTPPKIKLKGLVITGNLSFSYALLKSIAPYISVSLLIKDITRLLKENIFVVFLVFMMVLGLIYVFRKKISKKLTNFVVKHTDLSAADTDTQ